MSEQTKIKIALAGNPNCGKTSLFNALTGMRQKVGNFPGVTVDKKTGILQLLNKTEAIVIDLPGTYSIYPRRIDEMVTFDVLANPDNVSHPDVIVLLADASNLKRNLLFCTQVIDMGIPTVIALNMMDVAERNNIRIDVSKLENELGVPVVPMNARDGKGVDKLLKILSAPVAKPLRSFIDMQKLFPAAKQLSEKIPYSNEYEAALLAVLHHELNDFPEAKHKLVDEWKAASKFNDARFQGEEVLQRYNSINRVVNDCVKEEQKENKSLEATSRIDKILLHPLWGYLVFLVVFFLVFQAIFAWAQYPMDFISWIFSSAGNYLHHVLPDGMVSDLLIQGVWSGIGGVVVFIPQIMLLFGFITILEDTGYMARVSFLMDRLMRSTGLSGKSTVPLISGMACAIPAIMSTRNIESWKDRIITIMVVPFMSCSARLPVYTLLISFAVPSQTVFGIFNMRGMWMLGLYLFGFISAIVAAFIMKLIIKTKEKSLFLMELPIYRWPRWGNVGVTMLEKAKVFVTDAGKIIVAISVVLWFLASYGPGDEIKTVEKKFNDTAFTSQYNATDLDAMKQSEKLTHSYAGHIGHFIEPAIMPLGFDWKIGISLITAFAAREVFVGTISTIYSVGSDNDMDMKKLRDRMHNEINPRTGQQVFSYATVVSLMLFFALAMQCMSTIAVVRRETKSWKWPLIQLFYMTGVAYWVSFITFQLLK
ncbi:MAG: ferrous iron transport protein B [Bacteroidota bacterium]